MAWKKNSDEAVRRFERLVAVPGSVRATMFGCPVFSIGDERYAVLHEERIALKLSQDDGAALLRAGGRTWEPMPGRASKERFVVPDAMASDDEALRGWVKKAVAFAKKNAAPSKPATIKKASARKR